MIRRLYDKCIAYADKPSAPYVMGAVSFAESSFFPIPPDVLLIPMSIARPERALWYATIATFASVAGGILGYFIGLLLYDTIGLWLMQLYGYTDKVEAFREQYRINGHWIMLIKGVTPIPFKIVTITSGLAGYNFGWFVLLSVVARGVRFYGFALLIMWLGPSARHFIEKHLTLVTFAGLAALIGGFVVIKYVI